MKRKISILFIVIAVATITNTAAYAQGKKGLTDNYKLSEWIAGTTVTAKGVKEFGSLDKCFAAEPIPDKVWQRMQGKTYKENPNIQRDDLRYIRVLHIDHDKIIHIGEMVCNKIIADKLVSIFRHLYEAKYPIQRMQLPDEFEADDEKQMRANNTSCFCYRAIAGSKKLSKHSLGLAIDINPLYNPFYHDRADGTRIIKPTTAGDYCNRSKKFPYKIEKNDLCYKLFISNGFKWGGSWKTRKDFQHFEYNK